MAFTPDTLQAIGGLPRSGKGGRLWSYTTTDTEATVNGAGYFAEQRFAMRVGDCMIRTQLDGSGAHVETGFHVLVTKTPSSVTWATAELNVATSTGLPLDGGTLTGWLGLTTNLTATATGTNLATSAETDAQFTMITGGAADTGMALPAVDDVEFKYKNATATTKKIWPAADKTINGLALGEAWELPSGLSQAFIQKGSAICPM